MLTVTNLKKYYGSKCAVNGISFQVNKGDIFGIIGPNGAGKSTTLETILGTKKKDSGQVKIFGIDQSQLDKNVFSKIGVQFQESAYQTSIKVWEVCEFSAALYKNPIDWEEKLKQFNLSALRNSLVSDLSGGERQKLSILLASIHSPELLFLDELTTGLDPIARRETWDFIKKINKQGTTIILTSHFMDEVEALCNRGIIIKSGEILVKGTISTLIKQGNGKNLDESYINILQEVC